MQKSFYGLTLLFFIAAIPSCNRSAGSPTARTARVNEWFSKQTHYALINRDSTLHYATLIDSASKEMPVEYQAMALIGKARYNLGTKPMLAGRLYEQALQLLQNSNADSLVARAYNGLGVTYMKKADYSNALEFYLKALRIYEKDKDAAGIGGALANIGQLYQVKNDMPAAKKFILRSMEVNKKNNNIVSYLDAAQTLANIYGMSNQFDSALALDKMGVAAADSIGSTTIKSAFYNNMGNCYLYSNRPDSARYFFTQCLALDSTGGNLHFMVDNFLTLGGLSLQQKELQAAEQFYLKAINLADSIQEKQLKAQAWKELAVLYRQQNNLDKAITAKDSAAAVKDRIINEKSENKIAELKEVYETEKKEQTIALQEIKLSRQWLLLAGSAVLLTSLLFSGWLSYRRYTIRKERELEASLMEQREKAMLAILQAEDGERRRIAAELHDGVGQVMIAAWMNLQALESQVNTLDSQQQQSLAKAIAMVGDGCKEVREVSHAMMPNVLLNKGLENAVRNFTQEIDSSILSIRLHTQGLESRMDAMVETILYRVIQESVNNTIRHAAATELDISIDNNTDGISVLIEDNGKGFDPATVLSNHSATGLGLQNIKSRIAFLNGTVEWDSSEGNGTVVTIFIPVKKTNA
jgi:signal transduction histidine kinase